MTIDELIVAAKLYNMVDAKGHGRNYPAFYTWEQRFVDEHRDAQGESDHLFFDGLFTYIWWNRRVPEAFDLALTMFDEWDDPVSEEDAQHFLDRLYLSNSRSMER